MPDFTPFLLEVVSYKLKIIFNYVNCSDNNFISI